MMTKQKQKQKPNKKQNQKQTKEQEQKVSWDTILVVSSVISISVDPLFFYIPVINEEMKCIGVDKDVRTAAFVLRSVTDIAFILNIIFQIKNVTEKLRSRKRSSKNKAKNDEGKDASLSKPVTKSWYATDLAGVMPWISIIVDILAVLPIPQVLIAVFFKMRSSKYLSRRKIIDALLVCQYLPKIYRMHHSSIKQHKGPWTRGALYFLLYILASHVLGAFWYFFSIQRETSCWHKACLKHSASECNFYCDQNDSSRNMTFINSLDDFCLVDVPADATTPFDFGLFLDSLKSGNARQINFAKKFFYSFWWGLRNLSNFGTNLETSTSLIENCFAILISIVGLLLFLYLIGNVQTFIALETERTEQRRKMLDLTKRDIELWMKNHVKDEGLRKEINEIVKQKSEKIKNVDVENIINILPAQKRKRLKQAICLETLQKFKQIEFWVNKVCDYLKPVTYPDNTLIYRKGQPLDRMLLIIEGLIWTYNTASTIKRTTSQDATRRGTGSTCLRKGEIYGTQLLSWANRATAEDLKSMKNIPILNEHVKAHGKVEGFILMVKDLNTVYEKHGNFLRLQSTENCHEKMMLLAGKTIMERFREFKQRKQLSELKDQQKQDHKKGCCYPLGLMALKPSDRLAQAKQNPQKELDVPQTSAADNEMV